MSADFCRLSHPICHTFHGSQLDQQRQQTAPQKAPAAAGFPGGTAGEESACNMGALGSIPGSGRSPGGGKGYPLQYSGLENPMDRGAWMGCSPRGRTELDTTERLPLPQCFSHCSHGGRSSHGGHSSRGGRLAGNSTDMYPCPWLLVHTCRSASRVMPRNGIAGLNGTRVFKLSRCCQPVL